MNRSAGARRQRRRGSAARRLHRGRRLSKTLCLATATNRPMTSASEYVPSFNQLAVTQPRLGGNDEIKLWISANPTHFVDVEGVVATVRQTLKPFFPRTEDIVGRCFSSVAMASQALLSKSIKHTVTVGDVLVNGKSYFNATEDSIKTDMQAGFLEAEPANAHAWITLENGLILDITILTSLALRNRHRTPKWAKAIYVSDQSSLYQLRHLPYFLGPEYIARVSAPLSEASVLLSIHWAQQIDDVLRS
jgi:hypothetical protein